MSQYPQPLPPDQFLANDTASRRPTAVLVIAIIVIIFSAMAILCSPFQVLSTMIKLSDQPNPAVDAIYNSKLLKGVTVAQVVLGMALGVAQLVAAISAIRMKLWARKAMINLAVVELAFAVLSVLIYFILMYPEISKEAQKDPNFKILLPAMAVGTIGGALFRIILPVVTIVLFRGRKVKDAFENPSPAAAGQSLAL